MLEPYTNQTCTLEKYSATADPTYNDRRYFEPVELACRREPFVKNSYKEDGDVTVSTTRYFISIEALKQQGLEPNDVKKMAIEVWKDRIDGKVVQEVDEYIWLDGSRVGYEVYV